MLWNNAGQGESGPVWEIPIDLVRRNCEINVFLPLVLTQGVLKKWVSEGRAGKIVDSAGPTSLSHCSHAMAIRYCPDDSAGEI